MARPVGSPLTENKLRIYIPESWVMKVGKRRFVFTDVLNPKIHQLSIAATGKRALYNRYHQILHRDMYNTEMFYGLLAINIDEPQNTPNSVTLEFIIGEGQDEVEKIS